MVLSDILNPLSRSSFFRQPLLTVFLAPFRAAIMASIFARCSGVSLASTSAGMGGIPLICPFNVVCHSPGFTSNGRKSAAQSAEQASIASPIEILVVMGSSLPFHRLFSLRTRGHGRPIPATLKFAEFKRVFRLSYRHRGRRAGSSGAWQAVGCARGTRGCYREPQY